METSQKNKALISNWVHFPKEQVSDGDKRILRRHLTFLPRDLSGDGDVEPILLYNETDTYFSVPLSMPYEYIPSGLHELLENPEYDLSDGATVAFDRRPDPNHPSVRNPDAQREFMANMLEEANNKLGFIACAATGSGKTACALNTIAELGKNALVIVPTEYLAGQWEESIKNLLGASDDDIGRLQGDTIDIIGKKIVITIVNSVAMRDYPEWVYSHFGIVVGDEVHRLGSRVFSRALPRFNARHKIGLSATPKRKDGADKVIQYHLGQVSVVSEATALRGKVFAMGYDTDKPLWGTTHGARVKCLTLDGRRNKLIVNIIRMLYSKDRDILVVSDSIAHLQTLMSMCESRGIPRSDMGQFTGQRYLLSGAKEKVKREELEYIKQNSKIIFATYQMMKEGVDIPRLDAGIDATPRSDATQLIGRIRRPYPNKNKPIWYTIVDKKSKVFTGNYRSRKKEYLATNMEVEEYG